MIMTSEAVRLELSRIDELINALRSSSPASADDLDDVLSLKGRRAYLGALLAVRGAQRGKRLVSLDLWRNGKADRAVAIAA